ncbi:N-acetylmuramoyl-L-alanine amidase [Floccifex sp.]|uniref:N-acetylmuramoyl-L-alanine amidase n=1 Tax=Floccifex sp. TaxID=2815810 RepID=UPI003F0DEEE5
MKKIYKTVTMLVLCLGLFFTNCFSLTIFANENNNEPQIGNSTDIEYFLIEKQSVSVNEIQNFVLSLRTDLSYENLSLSVIDSNGMDYEINANEINDNLIKFSASFSSIGEYVVTRIDYSLDGISYYINLSDIGIDAKFGVDQEVYSQDELINLEDIADESIEGIVKVDSDNIEQAIEQQLNTSNVSTYALNELDDQEEIIVALDAGHGGSESGTYTYYSEQTGLYEKDYNLKITTYCKEELEKYNNVKVIMTRESDTYLTLEERCEYAYQQGAHYLISFHLNGLNGTNQGAIVFYPNNNYRPDLAEEGKAIAQDILNELTSLGISSMGIQTLTIDGNDERYDYEDGSMGDYYGIIRGAKKRGMIGLIIEHCFADNKEDFDSFLNSDEKLKALGIADANGIASSLGLNQQQTESEQFAWNNKDAIADGLYSIQQLGNALDYSDSLIVNSYSGVKTQLWNVKHTNQGYVTFRNEKTGSYLTRNGNQISVSSSNNNLNQYWIVTYTQGGYKIISASDIHYVLEFDENKVSLGYEDYSDNEYFNFLMPANNSVIYQTHVQSYGWQNTVEDGETSGTVGLGKRLEGIKIDIDGNLSGDISYRTHVQSYGWLDWVSNGQLSGTVGEAKRLEAIQIKLSGDVAKVYDVYYRVHAQYLGWLDWACNGQSAGTCGYGYRLEAIEIKLVKKDEQAPENTSQPYVSRKISYQTHVQSYGWQNEVFDGDISGTTGSSKRLESIVINLVDNEYEGAIEYRTHVQSYGWLDWVKNGKLSGTVGQAKRLEAIQIKLTGEIANYYDIYYRVHAQNIGWLDWAKNGQSAGTSGYGYRLEAIQIELVKKGSNAPGATLKPYVSNHIKYQTHVQSYGWQPYVMEGQMSGTQGEYKRLESIRIDLTNNEYKGTVQYRTHVQSYGWLDWVSNGQLSGTVGQAKRLEAIEIKLTGELSEIYDIYYRVHAQHFGWLDWAKNGQSAGTSGYGYRLEAIEIQLVKKGEAAPGETKNCYYDANQQDVGNTDYIFVGDSRIKQLSDSLNSEDTFVCENGSGYNWFTQTAIPKINSIMNQNSIIILNLGINDLNSASKYISKINSLMENEWKNHKVVYVTVNPVNQTKCSSISNEMIDDFNYDLYSSLNNVLWIDTNTDIIKTVNTDSTKTETDGIHYTDDINQLYYNQIMDSIQNNQFDKLSKKYKIMGNSNVTIDQMVRYFEANNSNYDHFTKYGTDYDGVLAQGGASTVEEFCKIYYEEAKAEGVNAEVAFGQMCLETGFLQFGGDVKPNQFNFAGLGATGGVPGNSFSTVREGIRAQIQHLKCYASTESLNQDKVDPRWSNSLRGKAVYVEYLGIQENPYGTGWAGAKNYGSRLMNCINAIKSY